MIIRGDIIECRRIFVKYRAGKANRGFTRVHALFTDQPEKAAPNGCGCRSSIPCYKIAAIDK